MELMGTLILILLSSIAYAENTAQMVGACQPACDYYRKTPLGQAVTNACGSAPTTLEGKKKAVSNTGTGKTYDNYAACQADIFSANVDSMGAKWGEIGQHCDAMELYKTASTLNMASAVINTAAAVVCSNSCSFALLSAGFIPLLTGGQTEIACLVSGLGAMSSDIAGVVQVQKSGEGKTMDWNNWMEHKEGVSAAVLSSLGEGAAITSSIAKRTSLSTTSKIMSCTSAAFLITTASLEWAAFAGNQNNAAAECNTISKLPGIGNAVIASESPGPTPNGRSSTAQFTGGGKSQIGSVLGTPNEGSLSVNNDSPTLAGAISPQSSASTGLLTSMPNKDQIPGLLKQAGVPLSSIASKLQTSSPSAVMASLGTLPDALSDLFKEEDKMIKDGKIALKGGSLTTYFASATSPSRKPSSVMEFGSRSVILTEEQKATIVIQVPANKPIDPQDVFHDGWNMSLFKIVSSRLVVTRDRIADLEWETRMNRALNGLPPKQIKLKN